MAVGRRSRPRFAVHYYKSSTLPPLWVILSLSNFWMKERSEFIQKQEPKARRDLQKGYTVLRGLSYFYAKRKWEGDPAPLCSAPLLRYPARKGSTTCGIFVCAPLFYQRVRTPLRMTRLNGVRYINKGCGVTTPTTFLRYTIISLIPCLLCGSS